LDRSPRTRRPGEEPAILSVNGESEPLQVKVPVPAGIFENAPHRLHRSARHDGDDQHGRRRQTGRRRPRRSVGASPPGRRAPTKATATGAAARKYTMAHTGSKDLGLGAPVAAEIRSQAIVLRLKFPDRCGQEVTGPDKEGARRRPVPGRMEQLGRPLYDRAE